MLPQHIKEAIILLAKHYHEAAEKQELIKQWLESEYGPEAVNNNRIRDILVSYVEQSNYPFSAIKELESILESEI